MNALDVVHDIPGRLRLRVPPGATVEGLAEAVTTRPGVTSATWSPRTRSLLVLYEPASGRVTDVVDAVARHAGLEAPDHAEAPHDGVGPVAAGAAFSGGMRETF